MRIERSRDLTADAGRFDLALDKTQRLLAQLPAAKSGTRSEQLSGDQLWLFAQELGVTEAATEATIFRPAPAAAMRIKACRAKSYRGYLQADAYVAYESFFTNPA